MKGTQIENAVMSVLLILGDNDPCPEWHRWLSRS